MFLKYLKHNNTMNKNFSLIILGLAVILMLGAVSANTVITGKIYNADYSATVSDATVEITCGDSQDAFQSTTSLSDGAYSVSYLNAICQQGSDLSVHAFKEGVGENTVLGEIHNNYPLQNFDLNLGIVNVPLVPEFGAIVAGLTILSALGVFFLVRRK
jgi:hypothetical protein